jgi:cytochrome P450
MIAMSKTFKNEPIFRFWRGWNPVVIFHKADHLDLMMSGSKNNQKSFEYDFLRPWLAEGLLTSYGDKWTVRRRYKLNKIF